MNPTLHVSGGQAFVPFASAVIQITFFSALFCSFGMHVVQFLLCAVRRMGLLTVVSFGAQTRPHEWITDL